MPLEVQIFLSFARETQYSEFDSTDKYASSCSNIFIFTIQTQTHTTYAYRNDVLAQKSIVATLERRIFRCISDGIKVNGT